MRLLTFPISHYCERARWALDLAGLAYEEQRMLQMFHIAPARRAGGRTLPVLIRPQGNLTDSSDIVKLATDHVPALLPEGEAALERELCDRLGVATRKLAYWWLLPHRELMLRYNNVGAPRWQSLLLTLGFGVAKQRVLDHLRINAGSVKDAEVITMADFDAIAERMNDGRRYLCGDRFTTADLTFAALAAPVLLPPEYGSPLPSLDELPAELRGKFERVRQHPAGQLALRLYREERKHTVNDDG